MPSTTRSSTNPLYPVLHDPESLLHQSQSQNPVPSAEDDLEEPNRDDISSSSLDQEFQDLVLQSENQQRHMSGKLSPSSAETDKGENFDDLLTDWVDPTSYAGRQIAVFRERLKSLGKPPVLYGSRDYRSWREAMLMYAEQVGVERLLSPTTVRPTSGARAQVWRECNKWLYTFLNASVSATARSHFTQPVEHNASDLWSILDSTFLEQSKTSRRRLIQEICSLERPRENNGDRTYIEKVISIKPQLDCLQYPIHDYLLFDIVMNHVSSSWKSYMQNKIDQVSENDTGPDDNSKACGTSLTACP